jgi:outer membrane protein insertion porin family
VAVTPIVKEDTTIKTGNGVSVTFDVKKNHKVKIGRIDFENNEVFPDSRLRASLKKTHQKSIKFWQGAKFKEKEYEDDKENLIDFYNSKGYRNAHLVSDSIYTINDKRIGIRMQVEEGNKYFFRNISWVGNSVYETEMLQTLLGIKSGDAYDKKTMQKRLGLGKEANPDDMSITSMYQNNGYLFFQIDPAETIIGADSIDLELKIFEGKQATINNVSITGNMRVNDEVIRRELYVRPGELYDRSMLMSTIRQLSQMQHFNPEAIMPDIQPVSNELVDIAFPLEEQASDRFEVSGGWGAGMFVGSVGVTLNNVSLKNFFKKGAWRPYPQGQGQQLAVRAQSNGSYYKSYSVSFTEPWLGGKKPNSLTVSTFYSDETNAYYVWQQGTKHFRTFGASVGLGRRLRWPDQYFTLYMEASYQRYNMQDWDYFLIKNGSSNILSVKTVFGRNSVDQPIYPRRGSDFSISLALTPPYSLWDGKDYADPNLKEQDRYGWIEYHKWLLKAQWYYPISRNNNLVLMARAQMGYIGSYNPNKPSPFEGFEVGGDGMSGYNVYGVDIVGLRGYENGSLTPYTNSGSYARAYNKYTVELRYPFILKPSSTIYGIVFGEAGNAFESWEKFDPFLLKRSLGLGVRMYLPIVGMLGIDWAYGFDKVPSTNERSGGHPHFMIGMQF